MYVYIYICVCVCVCVGWITLILLKSPSFGIPLLLAESFREVLIPPRHPRFQCKAPQAWDLLLAAEGHLRFKVLLGEFRQLESSTKVGDST